MGKIQIKRRGENSEVAIKNNKTLLAPGELLVDFKDNNKLYVGVGPDSEPKLIRADESEVVKKGTVSHTSDSVTEGATFNKGSLDIVIDAYKKSETYTQSEVNTAISEKISEMTGGESAAEVLSALNKYKKATDTEIYGSDKVASWTDGDGKYTPAYTADSRIDTLTQDKANKATTLEGYGITDAYTKTEVDGAIDAKIKWGSHLPTDIEFPEEINASPEGTIYLYIPN